LKGG
jgi:hypothetical protein